MSQYERWIVSATVRSRSNSYSKPFTPICLCMTFICSYIHDFAVANECHCTAWHHGMTSSLASAVDRCHVTCPAVITSPHRSQEIVLLLILNRHTRRSSAPGQCTGTFNNYLLLRTHRQHCLCVLMWQDNLLWDFVILAVLLVAFRIISYILLYVRSTKHD